jgi:hypothetical protein
MHRPNCRRVTQCTPGSCGTGVDLLASSLSEMSEAASPAEPGSPRRVVTGAGDDHIYSKTSCEGYDGSEAAKSSAAFRASYACGVAGELELIKQVSDWQLSSDVIDNGPYGLTCRSVAIAQFECLGEEL